MKKRSDKNEELRNVNAQEKYRVVGKWFVKVSRGLSVSIRSNFYKFHQENIVFKDVFFHFSIGDSNASLHNFCDQILGITQFNKHWRNNYLGKYLIRWQFCQNKVNNTINKFFAIFKL